KREDQMICEPVHRRRRIRQSGADDDEPAAALTAAHGIDNIPGSFGIDGDRPATVGRPECGDDGVGVCDRFSHTCAGDGIGTNGIQAGVVRQGERVIASTDGGDCMSRSQGFPAYPEPCRTCCAEHADTHPNLLATQLANGIVRKSYYLSYEKHSTLLRWMLWQSRRTRPWLPSR